MRKLLILLSLALLLGAGAYQLLSAQQGYLILAVGDYVVETTLWGALVLLALVVLVVFVLHRLWRLVLYPRSWWHSRAGRKKVKIRDRTAQGVIDYLEGNWPRATQNLTSAAGRSETPGVNYLGAAAASFNLGDEARCQALLEEAEEKGVLDPVAVGLLRTRLALQNHSYDKALALAEQLHRRSPSHPTVLRMLVSARRGLGDWQGLESLLPDLKKYRALSEAELETLEIAVYREIIGAFADKRPVNRTLGEQQAELDNLWGTVPKKLRRNSTLVAAYVRQLQQLGKADRAESRLRRFINRHWDDELAKLYGDIESDPASQLKTAEGWLKDHPDNAALLEALGRLCVRAELWGKGREYFEMALRKHPHASLWLAQGELLQTLGDSAGSLECYRKGLKQLSAAEDGPATGG